MHERQHLLNHFASELHAETCCMTPLGICITDYCIRQRVHFLRVFLCIVDCGVKCIKRSSACRRSAWAVMVHFMHVYACH